MMGPVQVLVVTFEHPRFAGEVLAEFDRLRARGIVRLIDVLLVERTANGSFDTLDLPTELAGRLPADSGVIVAAAMAADGMPDAGVSADEPSWSLADSVPVGAVAAVALIEHVWAGPLVSAIDSTGGELVEEAWLPPQNATVLDAMVQATCP
jgi:hypothetical protein